MIYQLHELASIVLLQLDCCHPPPHGFSTDLYFKVMALAELCSVSSDKLKKKLVMFPLVLLLY